MCLNSSWAAPVPQIETVMIFSVSIIFCLLYHCKFLLLFLCLTCWIQLYLQHSTQNKTTKNMTHIFIYLYQTSIFICLRDFLISVSNPFHELRLLTTCLYPSTFPFLLWYSLRSPSHSLLPWTFCCFLNRPNIASLGGLSTCCPAWYCLWFFYHWFQIFAQILTSKLAFFWFPAHLFCAIAL